MIRSIDFYLAGGNHVFLASQTFSAVCENKSVLCQHARYLSGLMESSDFSATQLLDKTYETWNPERVRGTIRSSYDIGLAIWTTQNLEGVSGWPFYLKGIKINTDL
mgnify:CR=1 FL=1